jgi:hypothetical protein
MKEILVRALLGGVLVSAFAVLGDVLKPKSFAGLFAAATSVALATLSLAVMDRGAGYASIEARSMVAGAIAFCIYAAVTTRLLIRGRLSALLATGISLLVWFGSAAALWAMFLRSA